MCGVRTVTLTYAEATRFDQDTLGRGKASMLLQRLRANYRPESRRLEVSERDVLDVEGVIKRGDGPKNVYYHRIACIYDAVKRSEASSWLTPWAN